MAVYAASFTDGCECQSGPYQARRRRGALCLLEAKTI